MRMKKTHWLLALLLAGAMPVFAAAPESCERVKEDIQQKIVNNGVEESAFTMDIVPNDQADRPDAQVVGHCANDTFKILYTRNGNEQQ
jgi:hypothetical protein